MDKLLEILTNLRPDVDFEEEKSLVDGNVFDSFDIISLIGEINEEYGIEIGVEDIVPEKFNSAETIYELIKKYTEN